MSRVTVPKPRFFRATLAFSLCRPYLPSRGNSVRAFFALYPASRQLTHLSQACFTNLGKQQELRPDRPHFYGQAHQRRTRMIKKFTALFSALFLVFTLSLALPLDSDAARMGGGRSFGSQPAMRAPTKAPAMQQQQRAQQTAPNQAATAQQPRRGLLGGFAGGMLGGLLAGTLIGSLLGGGAFSGVGFMDILLLLVIVGGVIFFLRKKRAAQPAAQAAGYGPASNYTEQQAYDTNTMQRNSVKDAWSGLSNNQAQAAPSYQTNIPEGFDVEDFLRGAKMAYTRMQASWDKRDLDDIANFATDAVLDELRIQAKEDPNPSQTQIVLINAHLISVEEFGSMDRAQVYFDVLMREDPSQTQPANAREIWHFIRQHETGTWKLDGIQQIESC